MRGARADIYEDAKVVLSDGVALRRRLGLPRSRGLQVLHDALAGLKENSKVG